MLGRARRLAPYLLALAPFAFLPPAARADGEGEKPAEPARQHLVDAYLGGKKYPEAVKAAEDFRKEFPTSGVLAGIWDDQGQAHRLAGETDKAIVAFGNCAEAKVLKGLFDLVDVYIVD